MNPEVAREYAVEKHKGQTYGEVDYVFHLDGVSDTLERFGFSKAKYPVLHMSAYLHDVLEDTATHYSDIRRVFGTAVAEIVYAVTDELGRNRNERAKKTYPKIRGNVDALIIKLSDRISNMETAISERSDLLSMYVKEYPKFRTALFEENDFTKPLWLHLDILIDKAEKIK